jgi:hypothetical protein
MRRSLSAMAIAARGGPVPNRLDRPVGGMARRVLGSGAMMPTIAAPLAVLTAALLAMPGTAAAQSSAQAEQLFRDGKRLMTERRYREACAAFDASQRVEPTPATAMNLADCSEKAGQLATAWGWFLDVAAKTRGADAGVLHDTATRRAAVIEPRLSHLTVNVPDDSQVDGLVITLDHVVLARGAWNRAAPVDGGNHTVEAKAPGHTSWSAVLTVAPERDAQSVEVPILRPPPVVNGATATAPGPPAGPSPLQVSAQSEPPPAPRSRVVPIAIGAAALAAIAGGIVLERSAERAYDRSTAEPDDARQRDLYDSAVHQRGGAIALGAVGLIGGAAAVYLLVRPSTDHATVVPTANGLAIAGRF